MTTLLLCIVIFCGTVVGAFLGTAAILASLPLRKNRNYNPEKDKQ